MTYQNDPPNDSCIFWEFLSFADLVMPGVCSRGPLAWDSLESAFWQERTLLKYLECQAWFSLEKLQARYPKMMLFWTTIFLGWMEMVIFTNFSMVKMWKESPNWKKNGWKRCFSFYAFDSTIVWGHTGIPPNSGEIKPSLFFSCSGYVWTFMIHPELPAQTKLLGALWVGPCTQHWTKH